MTIQMPGQTPGSGPFRGRTPPAKPLEVGDIAPSLPLVRRSGAAFDHQADEQAGKLHVLIFLAGPGKPASDAALRAFEAKRDAFAELGAEVQIVLTDAEAADAATSGVSLPFPVLADKTGAAFKAVGIGVTYGRVLQDHAAVLAIAPNLHVLARVAPGDRGDPAEAVLRRAVPLFERRKAGLITAIHPPVLIVPDVFGADECQRLMEIYRTTGKEFVDPGHNQLQGRTTDVKMRIPEYGRSDRVDHWVCAAETNGYIDQRLVPRLVPEIEKAFNYKVTRHERYRIACYEGARGGSEHGHRDNTLPFVAHRRFAVTLNLNSDAYEGAELRFPEFGDGLYKPPSGAAIVFSCSLLHEVMGMRSGSRYALLAFLFGEN
ncbi:MAG: redoxin domain-containing protein [Alphaproteobacteria bacterium]|nr:redoxin domain-containing protein [Alphaproteobacteria bacterium]